MENYLLIWLTGQLKPLDNACIQVSRIKFVVKTSNALSKCWAANVTLVLLLFMEKIIV